MSILRGLIWDILTSAKNPEEMLDAVMGEISEAFPRPTALALHDSEDHYVLGAYDTP